MFHKVLVATGGSPWSNQAVRYAIDLAKGYALELIIMHVIADTPPYLIAEAGASVNRVLEGNEEAGRQLLADAVAWATEQGVSCDTELAWGRVAEAICRVAEERGCDLIVVGSRSLSGFKRLMLGSISNAVAAKAPCPVLVVKWSEET